MNPEALASAGFVALVGALLLYRSVRAANPGDFRMIEEGLAREAASTERWRRYRTGLWGLAALSAFAGIFAGGIAYGAAPIAVVLLARLSVHFRCLSASRKAAGMITAPLRLLASLALLAGGGGLAMAALVRALRVP